jgi:hypothetical protein
MGPMPWIAGEFRAPVQLLSGGPNLFRVSR